MSYVPAGYEDEYDSSDSDDFFIGGSISSDSQINGKLKSGSTNGSMGGFGMATPSNLHRDQQGSPLAMDDFKTAASRGKLDAVKEFIAKGMVVDCMLKAGWTALMYASSCGQAAMVQYLLEKGADPNFNRASFMYSPLMAVCSSNLAEQSILECLSLLTHHGANVNTHEKSHMTPLMFASLHGHARVVEKLLACGAQVNYSDNRRWTALFYAAEGGHRRVVELLLASRADPTKCCSDGKAADIAYSKGHEKLAELLEGASNPATSQMTNGTTSTPPPSSPAKVNGDSLAQGDANPTATTPTTTATTPTTTAATPTTTAAPPTTSSITNHQQPPPPPPLPLHAVTAATMTTSAANHQSYHVLDNLELFLHGLSLSSLTQAFKQHEVTFAQLLQMAEDDLEKIGVSQVGQRKKILDAIHAIHRKKWEPGSIRKPSSKILSLQETYSILDNISKHIAYVNSSIAYIDNNLATHNTLTNPRQEPGDLELVSKVGGELLISTRTLHQHVSHLQVKVNEASNSTDVTPADLITDPDERGMSPLKKTLMAVTALGALISMAWCSKRLGSVA